MHSIGIKVKTISYDWSIDDLSAEAASRQTGIDIDRLFKTIVLKGAKKGPFVCVVPGSTEVNLKKAALAFGEKTAEPIALKELEPITGYQRGGCSPVGMKRQLPVFIDESALLWDEISVNAGHRGLQMLIKAEDLARATMASFADLT